MRPFRSSPLSDDFCLVDDTDQTFALPIRQRAGNNLSQVRADSETTDDDYLLVSRPGSVVSFGSRSPTPVASDTQSRNTVPNPVAIGTQGRIAISQAAISDRTCSEHGRPPNAPCVRHPCSRLHPQLRSPSSAERSFASQHRYTYHTADHVSHEEGQIYPGSGVLMPPPGYRYSRPHVRQPSSNIPIQHSHPTGQSQGSRHARSSEHHALDKQIMDRLIDHAIPSHLKSESLTDAQLAQNMLVRLMSLPDHHPVVSELSRTRPALYHPAYRHVQERIAVYNRVFTTIERVTLSLIHQSHLHLNSECLFAEVSQFDQCWQQDIDGQMLLKANDLAHKIQKIGMTCMNLDTILTHVDSLICQGVVQADGARDSRARIETLRDRAIKGIILSPEMVKRQWHILATPMTNPTEVTTDRSSLPSWLKDRMGCRGFGDTHITNSELLDKRSDHTETNDQNQHLRHPSTFIASTMLPGFDWIPHTEEVRLIQWADICSQDSQKQVLALQDYKTQLALLKIQNRSREELRERRRRGLPEIRDEPPEWTVKWQGFSES